MTDIPPATASNWRSTDGRQEGAHIFASAWVQGGTTCTQCRWTVANQALQKAIAKHDELRSQGRAETTTLVGPALLDSLRRNGPRLDEADLFQGIRRLLGEGILQPFYREGVVSHRRFGGKLDIQMTGRPYWLAPRGFSRYRGEPDHYTEYQDVVFDQLGNAFLVSPLFLLRKGESKHGLVPFGQVQLGQFNKVLKWFEVSGPRQIDRPLQPVTRESMLALLSLR